MEQLDSLHLEARALGRTDYPKDFPLREVLVLARHCSGGVILGFSQFRANGGVWKAGTASERSTTDPVLVPTAWNQLEAGIMFGLGLPLLIFKESGVEGGVFDPGVTDVFVHSMPMGPVSKQKAGEIREVFLSWHSEVRRRYYG